MDPGSETDNDGTDGLLSMESYSEEGSFVSGGESGRCPETGAGDGRTRDRVLPAVQSATTEGRRGEGSVPTGTPQTSVGTKVPIGPTPRQPHTRRTGVSAHPTGVVGGGAGQTLCLPPDRGLDGGNEFESLRNLTEGCLDTSILPS